ncbi:MAG TPA: S8 family serine peptidase, partial [Pyrinomonadaceae bacterium]|nr:S8 family serine peptidase [Pyrinomonadaceae bacterium]
ANIGHLYTEANINSALAESPKPAQSSDIVKERDKAGHGTHVAATAAGNGLASPTPGVYAGMAPEADLIIVKASRENDGTDGFGSDDLVNGIAFVKQKAAELGEPFVINMSLGGHGGSPHDGTDPDERAIDNLVSSGTGRAVCVAAGNEGQSGGHASGTVTQGGDLALTLTDQNNPQSFTLYYANSDRFGLTVTLPNGTTLNAGAFNGNSVSNQYITIYNGTDDKQDSDPTNDQSSLFVVIKDGAEKLGPNWTFTLHGNSVSNGHFDAWIDDDNGSFSSPFADDSREVGSPGTSRGAITVGAFVTRSATQTINNYAYFTSPGPTADGRQKPDIGAPGYYLYSAKSSDIDSTNGITSFLYGTGPNAISSGVDTSKYGGLAGTSMATPVVTGSTALLLQANPNLTVDQIKSYYFQTSTHDSFTGAGWEPHFGNGKLNIAAAIRAAAPTSTPTVQLSSSAYSANESAGNVQVPVTLSVASSTAVSVDYATSDTAGLTPCNTFNGIASSRCDYITSVGTLTFAPGETQKIIYIPLVADGYTTEGNETFTVSLSNAQGAPLGSTSSATITILDNTTPSAGGSANPID